MNDGIYHSIQFLHGVAGLAVTFAVGAAFGLAGVSHADYICPILSAPSLAAVSYTHLVGAGTVLTTEQVDEAMAAGAQFIVTPGMDPDIVAYCQKVGIQIFPGCTTPTDYHTAYKFGLEVLKFVPAEQSGGCLLYTSGR